MTSLERIKAIEKEYECKMTCCDNHNSHETSLFLLKAFNVMREIANEGNWYFHKKRGCYPQHCDCPPLEKMVEREFEERMTAEDIKEG